MNKEISKINIENAFQQFKTAIEKHSNINIKRNDGGWSVGEIANHIVKATGADFGATKKTERDYGKHADSIKETFLNFNVKFPAAPFLHPDEKEYDKWELLQLLENNKEALLKMIDADGLTETCTDIELPVWGSLTKYEWLVLIENHIIRHTKQVNDFNKIIEK